MGCLVFFFFAFGWVAFFLQEEQQPGRHRRAALGAGMLCCWCHLSGSELLWGMLPASPLQSKHASASDYRAVYVMPAKLP